MHISVTKNMQIKLPDVVGLHNACGAAKTVINGADSAKQVDMLEEQPLQPVLRSLNLR